MAEVFEILPMAILYLACGFTFLCGFYILIDRRFDFFMDTSFTIMLVLGYLINAVVCAIPHNFGLKDEYTRNILIVILSFISGVLLAFLRNKLGSKINRFIVRHGRRKSSSELFWYDILDDKDKPMWIRLTNIDKNYILDGVLLSLSESKENPYLLLGYCKKYDLEGNFILGETDDGGEQYVQKIVRPDSFDEITVFYQEGSSKGIKLRVD